MRVQLSTTLADVPPVDEVAGCDELLHELKVSAVTAMAATRAASRRGFVGARMEVSCRDWHGCSWPSLTLGAQCWRGIRANPRSGRPVWRRALIETYGQAHEGILVERYWPGVTAADLRVVDDQVTWLSGADARFLRLSTRGAHPRT